MNFSHISIMVDNSFVYYLYDFVIVTITLLHNILFTLSQVHSLSFFVVLFLFFLEVLSLMLVRLHP